MFAKVVAGQLLATRILVGSLIFLHQVFFGTYCTLYTRQPDCDTTAPKREQSSAAVIAQRSAVVVSTLYIVVVIADSDEQPRLRPCKHKTKREIRKASSTSSGECSECIFTAARAQLGTHLIRSAFNSEPSKTVITLLLASSPRMTD
jgi:hypothetical protein